MEGGLLKISSKFSHYKIDNINRFYLSLRTLYAICFPVIAHKIYINLHHKNVFQLISNRYLTYYTWANITYMANTLNTSFPNVFVYQIASKRFTPYFPLCYTFVNSKSSIYYGHVSLLSNYFPKYNLFSEQNENISLGIIHWHGELLELCLVLVSLICSSAYI